MLDEKYQELIINIAEKYGKKAQVQQSVEEMSELIVELAQYNEEKQNPLITKAIKSMAKLIKVLEKNVNRDTDNINEIILEIADVTIMLAQLKALYNIDSEKLLRSYGI